MLDILDYMIFEDCFGYNCSSCGDLLISYADYDGLEFGVSYSIGCDSCGQVVEFTKD